MPTASPQVQDGGDAFTSAPLTALVGFTLKMAQVRMFEDFNRRLEGMALRPSAFAILTLIDCNPGCRASQIAEVLSIKRPNFVALLATLENRGLVARRRSSGDKRVFHLHLTAEGRAFLMAADGLVAAQEEQIATVLGSAGKAMLLALLGSLLREPFVNQPSA